MRPAMTDDDIARRKKIWRSNKRKGFIHFHRNCSAEVTPEFVRCYGERSAAHSSPIIE